MKIGIEAQRLFRPKKHGMDVVALELVKALQHLDTPHEYFVFVKPDEDVCLTDSPNCRIVPIPGSNYATWEQIQLPSYARKYGIDVLHCTANTAPIWPGVPLVVTLHDVIFMEKMTGPNTQTSYQRFGNMYRRWVVPKIIKKCEKIVTVSHYEKERIQKTLQLPDNAVEVAYNGVSNRFSTPPNMDEQLWVKERFKLPERFFFFLGNTDPKKNMPTVIKAYAQLAESVPDVKLVIADIAPEIIEAILSTLGKRELMAQMVFPGYIPGQYLPSVYHQCEVFLYPSLRESFGLPILEAMTCGVPVITSNAAAMPEVAGDAAFLVDPTNADDITATMKKALLDLPLRQKKIAEGLKRPALFTWEYTARTMLHIYEQIKPSHD
ncbi:glycosyltransferase family 1 protein [Telluribacter sp.]|jgi:glycosyltransferase involved in cell wall biosynthesis|uniref:glycosyltransferase family 4 protein n=1 Tax=Telluribacter sp. TaxID=1978767 RepID=UPI002E0EDBC9|nr:glycosyltransferase family 1 protein [Telluribacter sp.]